MGDRPEKHAGTCRLWQGINLKCEIIRMAALEHSSKSWHRKSMAHHPLKQLKGNSFALTEKARRECLRGN